MMKVKSTGKSYHTIDDVKIQKVSRYYVSRNGGVLKKHMPPSITFSNGSSFFIFIPRKLSNL
jgi:hypothetical protein